MSFRFIAVDEYCPYNNGNWEWNRVFSVSDCPEYMIVRNMTLSSCLCSWVDGAFKFSIYVMLLVIEVTLYLELFFVLIVAKGGITWSHQEAKQLWSDITAMQYQLGQPSPFLLCSQFPRPAEYDLEEWNLTGQYTVRNHSSTRLPDPAIPNAKKRRGEFSEKRNCLSKIK